MFLHQGACCWLESCPWDPQGRGEAGPLTANVPLDALSLLSAPVSPPPPHNRIKRNKLLLSGYCMASGFVVFS